MEYEDLVFLEEQRLKKSAADKESSKNFWFWCSYYDSDFVSMLNQVFIEGFIAGIQFRREEG